MPGYHVITGLPRAPPGCWYMSMPSTPNITHPIQRLGRLSLTPGLRGLVPDPAGSGLAVTATVAVPDTPVSRASAWEVAWADAAREAASLGADPDTAKALERGAGTATAGGTRVAVAAHREVVLAWWLPSGAGVSSVRVGPLPHLLEVADAAARRPAFVVLLADRDGTDIVAHAAGDQVPGHLLEPGDRPGAQHDPHPGRPPALHHGERHLTDSEPESGGQRNAEFIAARVAEVAASVGAHIVLGSGDQHILDAVAGHLPETIGPVTAIAGGRTADGRDDHLSAEINAALDAITSAAVSAVADLVASAAGGTSPGAVRGVKDVAEQLAEQQVAVLLVAADVARDAQGSTYWIGSHPTELLVGEDGTGVEVRLDDGLVWAAVHQDAIVVVWPDRTGPLAGEPAAALLRRGTAR
jgi:hypothetical protein